MSKNIEKLRNDLLEIAEVVNSFQSESVQMKVVDILLNDILTPHQPAAKDKVLTPGVPKRKKIGSTKAMALLLATDFLNTSRSIAEIAEACTGETGTEFTTAEISGVLLALMKQNKLIREVSAETNRYVYSKPA